MVDSSFPSAHEKFGKCSAIFFLKHSFSPNLFLMSFWDFDDGSVAIFPQVPEALLIFSVYFISVVQGKSY